MPIKENLITYDCFRENLCSPEKNPDEYLNCDLKQGLSQKPSPKTQEKLTEHLTEHMVLLQNSPQRVQKYFKHKDIKYAA